MGTKNEPGAFDCYANAESDEPMFVLLARDAAAPDAVRRWTTQRVAWGVNQPSDPQIVEARRCALAMDEWRLRRRQQREAEDQ